MLAPDRLRDTALQLRQLTTDSDQPLRQGVYQSPLRDERLAAILGASLGTLFSIAFVTGLYSHLHQHPISWLPAPARPAGLYRITQGVHVAAGIASLPVLVAKLWVVWPRFVSFPPVKRLSHVVERIGLLPLVAGGVFMVFSGVANIAQWYPWHFGFPAAHYWMAWVTMGAMTAHLGAKWLIARQALRRPSRRPALDAADPSLGTVAEPAHAGLNRRGFLATVAAASGALTLATIGQTWRPLRRLALLAPRDPDVGPQGRPVNRSAANAHVSAAAAGAAYRLTVEGKVSRPLSFTVEQLRALPTHEATLPIACVEGWSYSAPWRGVRVRDLLAMVGAPARAAAHVVSLEANSPYSVSYLDPDQAHDVDTLLATHLDGRVLDLDHGFPVRLIGPGRPGVNQTKWVTKLVVG
jgi:DMSO/TMAO reductase YedYZ molybdopterin-dependent catalytic subunit